MPPAPDDDDPVSSGSQAQRAIAYAESKLGRPYAWATAGPDTFDCSGFTWWVASQVLGPLDYELRSSHHQFNVWGDAVSGAPGQGDLVFFRTTPAVVMGNRASHVGMMLDRERFIHAANEELGVRIDRFDAAWYAPKYIGARRIFANSPASTGGSSRAMRFPNGPIRTPAPWNELPFGVDWSLIARHGALIEAAAARRNLDPRYLAVVVAIETQGIHERDGEVLEVWDNHPQDGPSVGITQPKPKVRQWLCPECDPYELEGNMDLGAAVLRYEIDRHGSFEAAIAEGYHPGVSPNGTTPQSYVRAAQGLLGELDAA